MKNITNLLIAIALLYLSNAYKIYAQEKGDYFKIKVIDEQTERGVPLVELKTTNDIRYYTDNNGIIAFYEPGLMDQKVHFFIKSHGYEYSVDGFGYRGTALFITKGDSALIKLKRINIAERLYRITGQGLYHHSILAEQSVPIKQHDLNGKVMGQDTYIETLYKGKLYWFWGDTDRPSYPLGNFSTSGATSELPWNGGLDPGVGVELTYFVDSNGFSKPMCPVQGPGPVWIHWLTNLKDENSTERLITSYSRIKTLGEAYERGIAIFNDSAEIFKPITRFDLNFQLFPNGHPLRVIVDETEYLYFSFSTPYSIRVRADLEHITNPESYQAFTCLVEGSTYDKSNSKLDRGSDGRLIYSWKTNTEPVSYSQQSELIKAGKIKPEEAWIQLQDIERGTPVVSHAGSVHWNKFRKRWIMIFHEKGGTSNLGEVWYAEGDTPSGPWVYAKKIVTHDRYSFYNVGQHPIFDQENGRLIYFEGTYTKSFSNSPFATPRYDYNQIMYRLDLNDRKLYLPVPVYQITNVQDQQVYHLRESIDSLNIWNRIDQIPFFAIAPDRNADGLIPVYQVSDNGKIRLNIITDLETEPVFYGIPDFATKPEKFQGKWNCKADNYLLQMEITMKGDKLDITFNEKELLVTKAMFINDSIVFNIRDTSDKTDYLIRTSVLDGIMKGDGKKIGTKEVFRWEGVWTDPLWKLSASSSVVPLYEYKNGTGGYYYSTESQLSNMKRSRKPICHVWKNPSTTISLDYKANPVPIEK